MFKQRKRNVMKWVEEEDYIKGINTRTGFEFLISKEDFDKVKDINWHGNAYRYAKNNVVGLLHRYILDVPKGLEVDHINRNRLDNRRENLKICDRQENMKNKSLYKNSSSGYPGVKWNKKLEKWQVQININKKRIHIGVFDDLGEAIQARKSYE